MSLVIIAETIAHAEHTLKSTAFELRCALEDAETASIRDAMHTATGLALAILEDELTRRAYAR